MDSKEDKNFKNNANNSLKDLSKDKELEKVSGGTIVYDTAGNRLYDRGALKGVQDHKFCPECGGWELIDTGNRGLICKKCGLRRSEW